MSKKTILVMFRCPDCGEVWKNKGERYRDGYYGWCLEMDEQYCPVCNAEGVVMDDEEGRDIWAERMDDGRKKGD